MITVLEVYVEYLFLYSASIHSGHNDISQDTVVKEDSIVLGTGALPHLTAPRLHGHVVRGAGAQVHADLPVPGSKHS